MPKDIPHGHGRSHKRGLADSLLDEKNQNYDGEYTPEDLPNGHGESYKRGRKEGDALRKQINSRVKD